MSDTATAQATADDAGSAAADTDAIYDQAFTEFLSDDAPDNTAEQATQSAAAEAEAPATEQATEAEAQQQAPQFSDDEAQLLSRSHITAEMTAGWTPEQREDFFANAKQREDEQASYARGKGDEVAELERRLEKLEEAKGDQTAQATDDANQTSELVDQLTSAVDTLSGVYGDEMKAFADPLKALAAKAEQADKHAEQLQQTQTALTVQNRIIVDMVTEQGLRDLESDFPSLSEEKPRADVHAKFVELWQADKSPYRTGDGPFLQRIGKAMKAAAESTLGQKTEAAAQAALLQKTKEQLAQQPGDGAGRTETKPLSEDELYDQAFSEHLKGK